MSKVMVRVLAALLTLALVATACGGDDDDAAGGAGEDSSGDVDSGEDSGDDSGDTVDHEAIGLWDDGPCDESMEPLEIGMMTVYESPVLSLEDQVFALEASAAAFNGRGGANGACIEVTGCDDGGVLDQAVSCVRQVDEAGVVATVNDQGTAGQAEVSEAMAAAGIPRVASNVTSNDWGDQNAFPLDASGSGVTFLMPQALISEGVDEIGLIRVDLAGASVLTSLLGDIYEGEAEFPVDVPVPGGTTDFSQFLLAAENGGVGGVTLALGEQEAVQIVRAGEQLGSSLQIGASLGTFSHTSVSDLGDYAENLVFVWSFAPATADIPIYEALRADLAASGEESLQIENLKASPMRSWLGLYALLWMIREDGMTDFTRDGVTAMLEASGPVPMHGVFGGEDWTPDLDHPGVFSRGGVDRWASYRWDPEAEAPDGLEGNFVESSPISFDEVLCGSPFGAPEPC